MHSWLCAVSGNARLHFIDHMLCSSDRETFLERVNHPGNVQLIIEPLTTVNDPKFTPRLLDFYDSKRSRNHELVSQTISVGRL